MVYTVTIDYARDGLDLIWVHCDMCPIKRSKMTNGRGRIKKFRFRFPDPVSTV